MALTAAKYYKYEYCWYFYGLNKPFIQTCSLWGEKGVVWACRQNEGGTGDYGYQIGGGEEEICWASVAGEIPIQWFVSFSQYSVIFTYLSKFFFQNICNA